MSQSTDKDSDDFDVTEVADVLRQLQESGINIRSIVTGQKHINECSRRDNHV